jgi:hypothetical protein
VSCSKHLQLWKRLHRSAATRLQGSDTDQLANEAPQATPSRHPENSPARKTTLRPPVYKSKIRWQRLGFISKPSRVPSSSHRFRKRWQPPGSDTKKLACRSLRADFHHIRAVCKWADPTFPLPPPHPKTLSPKP